MAWQSSGDRISSPDCFLFAGGLFSPPSSSGSVCILPLPCIGSSLNVDGSGILTAGRGNDGLDSCQFVSRPLTKFEPATNTHPAIYSDRGHGAVFLSLKTGGGDVYHYFNYVGVRNYGPDACFNISSVVPSDTSGNYALEEMEVFTIQYN